MLGVTFRSFSLRVIVLHSFLLCLVFFCLLSFVHSFFLPRSLPFLLPSVYADIEMRLVFCLVDMEFTGLGARPSLLATKQAEVLQRIKMINAIINHSVGRDVLLTSPKGMTRRMRKRRRKIR